MQSPAASVTRAPPARRSKLLNASLILVGLSLLAFAVYTEVQLVEAAGALLLERRSRDEVRARTGPERLHPLSAGRPLRSSSRLQRNAAFSRAAPDEGIRDRGAGTRHASARRPDRGGLRAPLSGEVAGRPANTRLPRRAAIQLRLSGAGIPGLRGDSGARRPGAAVHRKPRAARRHLSDPQPRSRMDASRARRRFSVHEGGGLRLRCAGRQHARDPDREIPALALRDNELDHGQAAPDVLGDAPRVFAGAEYIGPAAARSCSTI